MGRFSSYDVLPISRDNITVTEDENGKGEIFVDFGLNSFSCTYADSKSRLAAMKQLSEMMQKRIIGITEHDLMMKIGEIF